MKVIPRTKNRKSVKFSVLNPGDAFIWRDGICIKGSANQILIDLNTGFTCYDNCDELVVPVEATVNWKHKEFKKRNKK
jgi:hypothetical protein